MSENNFDGDLSSTNPYPSDSPLPDNTEALKSQIFEEITKMNKKPATPKSRLTKAAIGTAAALFGAVAIVGLPGATPAAVAEIQSGAEARNNEDSGTVDFACSITGLADTEISDYAFNLSKSVDGEDFVESWSAVPLEGGFAVEEFEIDDLGELGLSDEEIAEFETQGGPDGAFVVTEEASDIEVFELDGEALTDTEIEELIASGELSELDNGTFIEALEIDESEIAEELGLNEEELQEFELELIEEFKYIDGTLYTNELDAQSGWVTAEEVTPAELAEWESIAIPEGPELVDAQELTALLDESGDFEVVELEDGIVTYSGPATFSDFDCAEDVIDAELFDLIEQDLDVVANAELTDNVLQGFELAIDGSDLDFEQLAKELGVDEEDIIFEEAVMAWNFTDLDDDADFVTPTSDKTTEE